MTLADLDSQAQRRADTAVTLLERQVAARWSNIMAAAVVPGVVASFQAENRPLTEAEIRPLYDLAVRADQVRGDAANPFSHASGFTRTLAGLRGAISGLQIAEGDRDAHQYLTVIQDAAQAASRGPTPVARLRQRPAWWRQSELAG